MAAYTSLNAGEWNNQANWNDGASGYPDGADDTATVTHAMTCAAGIVSGAVTINAGGDVNTGASASTITSITTASTGTCTIGAGGATLAGPLNNAGTGLLTINGAVTGVTTFTTRDCNMNANVACTGVTVAAAKTFTMAASTQLTGLTGNVTVFGTLTAGAGCLFSGAKVGELNILLSGETPVLNLNGTSGSHITLTNTTANRSFSINYGSAGGLASAIMATWVDGGRVVCNGICGIYIFEDCFFYTGSADSTNSSVRGNAIFRRCFIGGRSTSGQLVLGLRGMMTILEDVAIGYQRNGSTSAGTGPGISAETEGGWFTGRNVIINSTTQVVVPNTTQPNRLGAMYIENYGHLCAAMLPGTASALDAAVVDAGVTKTWTGVGTVERSTANPPAGKTYHSRLTPSSTMLTSDPKSLLEMSVWVPIQSGQNVAAAAQANRSANPLTAACAECQIDPEGAWFAGTTAVAWNLVNPATYYALPACSAAGAGGVGAKGMCRIVFRILEYSVGTFVDIGDCVISVT